MHLRTIAAGLALALACAAGTALAQQSKGTILKYDAQGRVIGSVTTGGDSGDAAARGDPPARSGPDASLPENRYEAGEIIVANVPAEFERDAQRLGFRVLESVRLEALGFAVVRLRIPPNSSVPEARETLLRTFPGIVADANHLYEPSATPPSSLRDGSLARWLVGWEQAGPSCGRGVRLGMIDGALDTDHPALKGSRIEYRSFHRDGRKPAAFSHGTAIAALLVGEPANKGWGGLLPGAQLFAGNMFEEEDGDVGGNALAMVKALDWLVESKVHAINLSVAGAANQVMELAFRKAALDNAVMIAAAGNWGTADRPAYPAAFDSVVAVTAVDEERLVYTKANRGAYIDFAAPGVKIWTAVPGGGQYQSGTSFATPFISVLAALQAAKGRTDIAAIQVALATQAADLGAPGRDDVFGFGLVLAKPECMG